MPNSIAYLMLLLWPVAALVFFQRLPLQRAILLCLIGGYLILPPIAAFDFPLIPAFDKFSISSIMALVGCVFIAKAPVPFLPRSTIVRIFVCAFVICAIPTVLTNLDSIAFRPIFDTAPIEIINWSLPGLRWRDIGSEITNQLIVLIPFMIARRYLSTPDAHRDLLFAFCIGGLVYSLPSLFEIRMSPQLNIMIYGFFQHDFAQMIRSNGYRPIVFLPHALWLAIFMFSALVATATLARMSQGTDKIRLTLAACYLFVMLVLCKSFAALFYGLVFVPIIAFTSYKFQIRVALLIALFGCFYPVLKNAGLIPQDLLLRQLTHISPDRAQSLGYRFMNEQILLDRAAEKPWFGWGNWGRNLVRDPVSGLIQSIPDGHWIIAFGSKGWIGYLSEMGILTATFFLLWRAMKQTASAAFSPYVSCIALILGANMIDMLLNDTLVPVTWMCAGAICGYAERLLYPGLFDPRPKLFQGRQAIDGHDPATRQKPLLE
ncbi:O-antigen ligase [Phaeobacter sp. HF9A]|uniref:O-antigen ligase family protein n=1 Tax=Phaeobacter sp. HF9A TaxID=2721561 RepID=UPI00142F63FF|nr:hypothetical protein [Phaeobacter sp. HF9A]NIZ14250.1 hypothetical protein [Phaeobacter sp. HF9A]